jgi:hypothetical protein
MSEESKKPLGQLIYETQNNDGVRTAEELKEWFNKKYWDDLQGCYEGGRKASPKKIFYIEVVNRVEPYYQNRAAHPVFAARAACPTPQYTQSVYECNPLKDTIEHLWTMPSDKEARLIYDDPLRAIVSQHMKRTVIDFFDGSLLESVKKRNNERLDFEHDIIFYDKEGAA